MPAAEVRPEYRRVKRPSRGLAENTSKGTGESSSSLLHLDHDSLHIYISQRKWVGGFLQLREYSRQGLDPVHNHLGLYTVIM